MFDIRLSFSFDPKKLADDIQKQVRTIIDDELVNIAAELQQASPEGATGELKAGWDVIPSSRRRNLIEVQGTITNNAPAALFRVVGRGPGKFPPEQPLLDWVQIKLNVEPKKAKGVAFVIRRKIATKGTKSFIEKRNFAGLNPDGSYQPGSILDRGRQRMLARLNAIKIGKP